MAIEGPENNVSNVHHLSPIPAPANVFKLQWNPGHEKIPDNWYKRHPTDEYSINYCKLYSDPYTELRLTETLPVETDILYFAETQPEILSVGCNKGKVDTFSLLDPATLTTAGPDAAQIAKNPLCFGVEFALAELPGILGVTASALSPLANAAKGLNCPSIGSVNQSALTACPGFTLYGGPTGPVAPGAIQS